MNPTSPSPTHRLLERCLNDDDDAWSDFLAAHRSVFGAVRAARKRRVPEDEFLRWVPGWLYRKKKLHALYRAIDRKTAAGELTGPGGTDEYVRNYLAAVAASAVSDFAREIRPAGVQDVTDDGFPAPASDPLAPAERDAALSRVRDELLGLRPALRIPFWLKYSAALGPLPPDDLQDVAATADVPAADVQAMIDAELAAHAGAVYEVSSRLIGFLLDLPPDVNGKYAAVDTRVARAKRLLKEALRPTPPEDAE